MDKKERNIAWINKIINSDVSGKNGLSILPDKCIDCIVTSPPYFGLRDYGLEPTEWPEIKYNLFGFEIVVPAMTCCLGLEKTPKDFVGHIVHVFRLARPILKDEGTLWLNFGDSYCSTAPGTMGDGLRQHGILSGVSDSCSESRRKFRPKTPEGLKPKDLIGIPWMVAFALRGDGWFLRQENIWAKAYSTLHENFGSVMPESVTDRFVKSHEHVFLLSKSNKYYFDLESIKKDIKESSQKRLDQNVSDQNGSARVPGKTNGNMKAVVNNKMARNGTNVVGHSGDIQGGLTANKRSVWHHNPSNFSEAHFATFPQELIVDCIKAGSRVDGIVLDPFMGAGTTALVARKLNRNYIGFELNPKYIEIAKKRIYNELGAFA